MRILITGGAGFVGSSLARAFKKLFPSAIVVAFDNLHRRGAELNIGILQRHEVEFIHGDIRIAADLDDLRENFDVVIEASAEPSVLAGINESPRYVIQTNLIGTLNCLEFVRRRAGGIIFLSTSRVYSIAPLIGLPLIETPSRFEIDETAQIPGIGRAGVTEQFPTHLSRSLYGATKLCSELMIQEYAAAYGTGAVINRCGVIAGPGQFGRVDQGVFTLWVANHYFGKPLKYTGFGGTGKQVRDLLHPADLFELIRTQFLHIDRCKGEVFNVGGGTDISTSLLELTAICREITGRHVQIDSVSDTSAVDVPWYVSDYGVAEQRFAWRPGRNVREIVTDVTNWIRENERELRPIFG